MTWRCHTRRRNGDNDHHAESGNRKMINPTVQSHLDHWIPAAERQRNTAAERRRNKAQGEAQRALGHRITKSAAPNGGDGRTLRCSVNASLRLILVLSAVAFVINVSATRSYCQTPEAVSPSATAPAETVDAPRVARWSESLLWISVLLLILFVGIGAIIVFSRRYRAYLLVGDRKPTPDTDVWSMHRLPQEDDRDHDDRSDRGYDDTGEGRAPFGPDKSPPDEPTIG